MIARTWQASATTEGAQRYREHFVTKVQPALQATDGFRGASLLERQRDGDVEIRVITRWVSVDAIKDFAGSDIDTAVVEPAAQAALLDFATVVVHFEITAELTTG